MEPERYIERILETENLTDELEDKEAQLLLDWGLAELGPLLAKIEDPEIAGGKVNQLMAVMRKINRILGALEGRPSDALAADLIALDELRYVLQGLPPLPLTTAEYAQAAAILANLDTHGALDYLIHWRASTTKKPDEASGQE